MTDGSFFMRILPLAAACVLSACIAMQSPLERTPKIIPYASYKTHPKDNIVLVGGCFDVLHYGHIQFLKQAKAQGDYLIIALESDLSIQKWKKRIPIHNQQKRAENLIALRYVDEVVLLTPLKGYEDYLKLVHKMHPNVIAVTKDDPQLENKGKQARDIGARVAVVVNRIEPFSSSKIIQALS